MNNLTIIRKGIKKKIRLHEAQIFASVRSVPSYSRKLTKKLISE